MNFHDGKKGGLKLALLVVIVFLVSISFVYIVILKLIYLIKLLLK